MNIFIFHFHFLKLQLTHHKCVKPEYILFYNTVHYTHFIISSIYFYTKISQVPAISPGSTSMVTRVILTNQNVTNFHSDCPRLLINESIVFSSHDVMSNANV